MNAARNIVCTGDLFHGEAWLGSGGLHRDITIMKEGGENSFYFGRNILHAIVTKLRDRPKEKSFLFNIDEPFIRDDPHVEIVISKVVEEEQKNKETIRLSE